MAMTFRAWLVRGVAFGVASTGVVIALGVARPSAQAPRTTPPTFTKDIAPIFQSKCEACHRPNNMAPMSLITYEDARPWARAIAQRVETRQMPPWHIDKTIGIQQFKNDRSLTDEQIELIVRWVAAGAPKGDRGHATAKHWPDERGSSRGSACRSRHQIRAVCDAAAAPRGALFRTPASTEPRWVRAIEIRPATRKAAAITHHALCAAAALKT